MSINQWRIGKKGPPKQNLIGVAGVPIPDWVPIYAALYLDLFVDFKNNRAWVRGVPNTLTATSILNVSRASAKMQVDAAGNWSTVAANQPAINDLGLTVEEARTNSIRNNSNSGAMPGADNVELLGNSTFSGTVAGPWIVNVASGGGTVDFSTPGQVSIGGNGTDQSWIEQQISVVPGRQYILTLSGSATITVRVGATQGSSEFINNVNVQPNLTTTGQAYKIGFTPSTSVVWVRFLRALSGLGTITLASVQDGERIQNGTFVQNPLNASQNTIQAGWQWKNNAGTGTVVWNSGSGSVTMSGDNTNAAQICQAVSTVAGVAYTIGVDVSGAAAPHLYVGNAAYSASIGQLAVALGSGQKVQFTATAATTYITFGRAGSAVGTVANISVSSAGKLPDIWQFNGSTWLRRVVSTFSEKGLPYCRVELFGNPTTGWNIRPEPLITQIGASPSTPYAWSAFLRVVSNTGVTDMRATIISLNSSSVQNGAADGPNLIALTNGVVYRAQSIITTPADGAYVLPSINNGGQTFSGAAVSLVLDIAAAMVEQGSWASSVIMTTNGTVIRAADVITLNMAAMPYTIGSEITFYGKGTPFAPATYAAQQYLVNPENTSNSRASIGRSQTGNAFLQHINGTSNPSINGAAWAQGVSGKLAARLSASAARISFNGTLALGSGDTATSPSGNAYNNIAIGCQLAGSTRQFNGNIDEVAIAFNRYANDNELMGLTA